VNGAEVLVPACTTSVYLGRKNKEVGSGGGGATKGQLLPDCSEDLVVLLSRHPVPLRGLRVVEAMQGNSCIAVDEQPHGMATHTPCSSRRRSLETTATPEGDTTSTAYAWAHMTTNVAEAAPWATTPRVGFRHFQQLDVTPWTVTAAP
jgi:hypothetical protein